MAGDPPPTGVTGFDPIREQLGREARVHRNLAVDVLVVPANEVRLRLDRFESAIRKRTSWQGPAGLAAGFFANLLTLANSPSSLTLFNLNYDVWFGINLALFCGALAFVGLDLRAAYQARKGNTVEDVVTELRPPSLTPAPPSPQLKP